jgi:serine/threonine protein kinase
MFSFGFMIVGKAAHPMSARREVKGTGTYACVLKPPLPCIDTKRDDDGNTWGHSAIGKVFYHEPSATKELEQSWMLKDVDPHEKFSIHVREHCKVNPSEAALDGCGDIQSKFDRIRTSGKLSTQLIMRDGGINLKVFIKEKLYRIIPDPRVMLAALVKLAKGLRRLHGRHIAHLDLKLDNTVLEMGMDGLRLRFIDFGAIATDEVLDIITGPDDSWAMYIVYPPDFKIARNMLKLATLSGQRVDVERSIGFLQRCIGDAYGGMTALREIFDAKAKALADRVPTLSIQTTREAVSDEVSTLFSSTDVRSLEAEYGSTIELIAQGVDVYCFGMLILQIVSQWPETIWTQHSVTYQKLINIIATMTTPRRRHRRQMDDVVKDLKGLLADSLHAVPIATSHIQEDVGDRVDSDRRRHGSSDGKGGLDSPFGYEFFTSSSGRSSDSDSTSGSGKHVHPQRRRESVVYGPKGAARFSGSGFATTKGRTRRPETHTVESLVYSPRDRAGDPVRGRC